MSPGIPRRMGLRASRCLRCPEQSTGAAYKRLVSTCGRKRRCGNPGQLQDVRGTQRKDARDLLEASSLFRTEVYLPEGPTDDKPLFLVFTQGTSATSSTGFLPTLFLSLSLIGS